MSDIPWEAILGSVVACSSAIGGGIALAARRLIAYQEAAAEHRREMDRMRYDRDARMSDSLIETAGTLKDTQVIQANVAATLTSITQKLADLVEELSGADPERYKKLEEKWAGELLIAVKGVGDQVEDLRIEIGDQYKSLITVLSIPNK